MRSWRAFVSSNNPLHFDIEMYVPTVCTIFVARHFGLMTRPQLFCMHYSMPFAWISYWHQMLWNLFHTKTLIPYNTHQLVYHTRYTAVHCKLKHFPHYAYLSVVVVWLSPNYIDTVWVVECSSPPSPSASKDIIRLIISG